MIEEVKMGLNQNRLQLETRFHRLSLKQAYKTQSELKEQSYFHHMNFFLLLQSQVQDIIRQILKNIQCDQAKYVDFMKILHRLANETNHTIFLSADESPLIPFLFFIKQKIQQKLNNMSEEQMSYYETVLFQNNKLSQGFKNQYKIFQEFSIEKLVYLDMISVFFRENARYLAYCKVRTKLITPETIMFLFGFSQQTFWKLWAIYKRLKVNIMYNIPQEIENLVLLYQVVALRNRISRLIRKCRKDRIGKQVAPMNYQKNFIISTVYNIYKYNFCQLAFSTYEKEIQSLHLKSRHRILKDLIKANQHDLQQQLRKNILLIKIKYAVNFRSISKMLQLIANKQRKLITNMIQNQKRLETTQLQRLLPFIFLKDYTFQKAFSKFKLNKYDITNIEYLAMARHPIIKAFTKVACHQARELQIIISNMLTIEENHQKDFIMVKKMALSYQMLKDIPQIVNEKVTISKQDLISNVILITDCKRIKSFSIVRGIMNDQKYLGIVKKLMSSMKFSKPFIVIFNENDIQSQLQWRQFYRFQAHCISQYNSRIYVTDGLKYSKINKYLLTFMNIMVKSKSNFFTRSNFYDFVEAQILQTMFKLRKISSKRLEKMI